MNKQGELDKEAQVEVAKITARSAIVVAIITGFVGLLTGYLTHRSEPTPTIPLYADAGKIAILSFYRSLPRHTDDAWALIHPDRKKEIEKYGIASAETFGATYATTDTYRNVNVLFDKEEQTGARRYWVTFDVQDHLPSAVLYQGLSLPMQALVMDGIVNQNRLFEVVLADVRKQYDVPEARMPEIERHLLGLPAAAVFGPKIVSEIGRKFKLASPSGLPHGEKMSVWTRYIQHIELRNDNGWKIVEGLFPPVLEAYYPSGVEIPSLPNPL